MGIPGAEPQEYTPEDAAQNRALVLHSIRKRIELLQVEAKAAGFRLHATVVDPKEEAEFTGECLIDAVPTLLQEANELAKLADDLGYNVTIERVPMLPLTMGHTRPEVRIWPRLDPNRPT
jgi:hypothetical protein